MFVFHIIFANILYDGWFILAFMYHIHAFRTLMSACFPCINAARRGLDISTIPMRKYSFGAGIVPDIESPLTRQPLSPISSKVSSQGNMESAADESNIQNEKQQKTLTVNNFSFTTTTTTAKIDTMVDEENRTPEAKAMPIPTLTTPMKVSIPMNLSMTPAPASVPFGGDLVQQIEYSFEERRLGFVLA